MITCAPTQRCPAKINGRKLQIRLTVLQHHFVRHLRLARWGTVGASFQAFLSLSRPFRVTELSRDWLHNFPRTRTVPLFPDRPAIIPGWTSCWQRKRFLLAFPVQFPWVLPLSDSLSSPGSDRVVFIASTSSIYQGPNKGPQSAHI